MGCSASINIERNIDHESTRLIIVDYGDESSNSSTTSINIYSLQKRFQYESSLAIPGLEEDNGNEEKCSENFTFAIHSTKAILYMSGCIMGEEGVLNGLVLKCHLHHASEEAEPVLLQSDWTAATYPHVSCVYSCKGTDYLYVIGRDKVCCRLNLISSQTETLVDITIDMQDISRVQCCQGLLVFVTEDNDIFCFEPPRQLNDEWTCKSSFRLPSGKVAITNNGMFFFQLDDISLYSCDMRGKLNKLVIVDMSTTAARRATHLAVSGELAYLIGYFQSVERISVVEIHLLDSYTITSGYLNDTSKCHEAYLCVQSK